MSFRADPSPGRARASDMSPLGFEERHKVAIGLRETAEPTKGASAVEAGRVAFLRRRRHGVLSLVGADERGILRTAADVSVVSRPAYPTSFSSSIPRATVDGSWLCKEMAPRHLPALH